MFSSPSHPDESLWHRGGEGERESEWNEVIKRGAEGREKKRRKETDRRDMRDGKVTEMKEMWETHKGDTVPAKLIDRRGNRCLVLYKITPGNYIWNSYMPSFWSSTLHPPKILSVTTCWPAEPQSMTWAQVVQYNHHLYYCIIILTAYQKILNICCVASDSIS